MASLLPPGFDPATGKIRLGDSSSSPVNTSRSTSTSSSYTFGSARSLNLWERYDDAIIDAGNWLADVIDTVRTVFMWIILVGVWLAAIVGVIAAFVDGDVIEGLLGIFIGGPIVYYGSYIFAGIGYLLITVLLYAIRLIIWSGWTLLATLVVTAGILIGVSCSNEPTYSVSSTPKTETTTTYTTYVCTASTLNIRSAPSTSASVLGVLKRGQTCEVVTFIGGFAQIKYKNTLGYVSSAYVTRK